MAFKSGSGLSSVLILRNLEDDGAYSFSTADRTSAVVGFTSAPDKAMRLVPLLATTCNYAKWDVRDALAAANTEAEEAGSNAQVRIRDAVVHAVGTHEHACALYFLFSFTASLTIFLFMIDPTLTPTNG